MSGVNLEGCVKNDNSSWIVWVCYRWECDLSPQLPAECIVPTGLGNFFLWFSKTRLAGWHTLWIHQMPNAINYLKMALVESGWGGKGGKLIKTLCEGKWVEWKIIFHCVSVWEVSGPGLGPALLSFIVSDHKMRDGRRRAGTRSHTAESQRGFNIHASGASHVWKCHTNYRKYLSEWENTYICFFISLFVSSS